MNNENPFPELSPLADKSKLRYSDGSTLSFETLRSIKNEILATRGLFFTVTFIKKDGTIRQMLARTGVKLGVNGNGKACSDELLIKAYDMVKHTWRSFKVDRVVYFKCGQVELS